MNIKKLVVSMILIVGTLNTNCMEEPASKRLCTENKAAQKSVDKALFEAVINGNFEKVQNELGNGAFVNATDKCQNTPLHRATKNGHREIAALLLEHGANTEAVDCNKLTPLLVSDDEDIIRLLVEKGANINATDYRGETIMHICTSTARTDGLLQFLLQHGASLDSIDNNGWTPLTTAINSDDIDTVRFLLDHGASLNIGNSPLMEVICNDDSEYREDMVTLLLDHGADVNGTDSRGDTALHEAIYSCPLYISKLLVNRGADVNAKNNKGESVFDSFLEKVQEAQEVVLFDSFLLDVLNFLIKRKAQCNVTDKKKLAWLTKSISIYAQLADAIEEKEGSLSSVQNLLSPLQAEELQSFLNPALIYATQRLRPKIVTYLLGIGANDIKRALATHPYTYSYTYFQHEKDKYESIKTQLSRRLSLVDQIIRNVTIKVKLALIKGLSRLPSELIQKIVQSNNPTVLLLIATVYSKAATVELLLKNYSFFTDKDKAAALYLSVSHPDAKESEKIIKLLLKHTYSNTHVQAEEDTNQRKAAMELVQQALAQFPPQEK
jgi:ankyrin repeat protein